jgi:hypothetical protein
MGAITIHTSHISEVAVRGVWVAIWTLVVALVALTAPIFAGGGISNPGDLRTLAPVLEVKLKEWLAAWRAVQPHLRVEQFKKVDTRLIKDPWRTVDLSRPDDNPLRIFYVSSRDGRWIVDPYGGIVLEKQDSYFEVSGGPDTGVRLTDRKTSKERGLLFCGPGCGFQEAVWVSSDSFLVAGYGGAGLEQSCPRGLAVVPSISMFRPARDSFTWYAGPKGCEGVGFEYVIRKIQQKIPNVKY